MPESRILLDLIEPGKPLTGIEFHTAALDPGKPRVRIIMGSRTINLDADAFLSALINSYGHLATKIKEKVETVQCQQQP